MTDTESLRPPSSPDFEPGIFFDGLHVNDDVTDRRGRPLSVVWGSAIGEDECPHSKDSPMLAFPVSTWRLTATWDSGEMLSGLVSTRCSEGPRGHVPERCAWEKDASDAWLIETFFGRNPFRANLCVEELGLGHMREATRWENGSTPCMRSSLRLRRRGDLR